MTVRPLTILLSAVSAKSGGAAVYITALARSLAAENLPHSILLIVPSQLAGSLTSLAPNLQMIANDVGLRSPWRRLLWDQFALRRIVKRERVDVLIATSDFGLLFPPCRQILMLGNSLYFDPAYHTQILPHKSLKFRLQFMMRKWLVALSARCSNLVVVPSEPMRRLVTEALPRLDGRLVLNRFGCPLDALAQPEIPAVDSRGRFRLLYVSEYNDYKNLTVLLKAVACLVEQGRQDFYLVSTIDPWQFPKAEFVTRKEDQQLALSPLISSFVNFTGLRPYEEIPQLYAQSDLFVFPSVAESFGFPLVEAMASGLPILASDIAICRELCGDAAVYFSPSDPRDLADKIMLLRSNPELRKRLKKAGTRRALELFDWDTHVQRLLTLIHRTGWDALNLETNASRIRAQN